MSDIINYFDNNKLVLIFLAGSFLLNILLLSKNFFKKDSIDISSDKNLSAQKLSNDTVLDSNSSTQKQAVQEQVVHKVLDPSKAKKCFIGVGGGGSNILTDIARLDTDNIFIHINSDNNALRQKQSDYKILLTSDTKEDNWGCGGNTECGLNLIDDTVRQTIKEYTKYHETIYLMATLGGGVGSGSTPEIAKYLKSINKKIILHITLPFIFEGKSRLSTAKNSIELLKPYVDKISVFENNDLLESKKGLRESFQLASNKIYSKI